MTPHEGGHTEEIRVAAEIRCSRCGAGGKNSRGMPLIAVVFTNGEREWLLMNAQVKPSPFREDTLQPHQRLTLAELITGTADVEGISSSSDLDRIRDNMPWVVWDLEKPQDILDPHPYASVDCPRCSPTGENSSWFLDCRKIGERLKPGTVVKLAAREIASDGDTVPTPDRLLGYAPPAQRGKSGLDALKARWAHRIVDTSE